jgi:superfamily I DNA and/or RNA helicase
MDQKKIWREYIKAQSKILEHKSRPIVIDTTKSVQLNGLKLQLSIDQEIFKQVFKKEVEQIFNIQNFDFESGYIQTSVTNTTNITTEQLDKLKELAEICYIDFNENPVIEGLIKEKENNGKEELIKVIGELPTNEFFKNTGQILLSLEQWNKLSDIDGIKFSRIATARFTIKPSVKLIAETKFNRSIFLENFEDLATSEELTEDVFGYLASNLGIRVKQINILIKFDNDENNHKLDLAHELIKKNTNFYSYKTADNNLLIRLEIRKLKKNENNTYESAEISIKNIIESNFLNKEYRIEKRYFYSLDKGLDKTYFFNSFIDQNTVLYQTLVKSSENKSIFRLDQSFENIYIDFTTEEDLNQKVKYVKSIPYFEIYDRGKNHKYRFNIIFETRLHELQSNLEKELPNLNTKLIANGEKLIFRQFYQTGNKTEILARLNNQLNDFVDSESFNCTINDTFQEKYLCEENFELKVEQEEEKLSKLLREEFYYGNPQKEKFYLGKLQKVDYPDLHFLVDEERIEEVKENISEEIVKAIFPDLKGEKDKIKRLEDTVIKLDDENTKLPNDNAKVFLYDSSKAKIIENIDYLLSKTSEEWQDFENNLFSKSLNESQRQAIYKSLYADELALIQGPPGTGKSTAIAEIIWQHIRKEPKQKILLTSETNLAVDNAINRLKNGQNNVVKPIRFGNTDNLESEGYFYSLEAIENWQKSNSTESNTLSHWLSNIANRVKHQANEQIGSALDKWKNYLQKPDRETKKLFAEKYLEYVNLIGATGGSIGKLNSENKWTSFFNSYLNVFERDKYEKRTLNKFNWQNCESVDISFDTIIMDEASKATPPELALPVLFGRKSIIVGDHRQLPPMIDGEEIKDLLESIGEKALAKTLSHKEFEISQFERLFKNIDNSIKGTFDTQFRMHPSINEAISQFYKDDGGLKCGLQLDEAYHNSFDKWDSRYHGLQYKNILTPETHTIWVNVTTPEIQEGTSRVNFGEIEAIDNILIMLKKCEGKNEYNQWLSNQSQEEKQIGIISFYGKQINYLEKMLINSHNDLYFGKGKENDKKNLVRLSTVDRFQGMERNIIIVSMVRSNKLASFKGQQPDEIYGESGYPLQESLGFAESPNRLNVALSRARRLLIVVGNSEHFCRKDIYKNVFETIQHNGRIISAEELQNAVDQNG